MKYIFSISLLMLSGCVTKGSFQSENDGWFDTSAGLVYCKSFTGGKSDDASPRCYLPELFKLKNDR